MFHHLKRKLPYLLVFAFFYIFAELLINHLPMDDLLRKALYVNNILFYSPLVTLLVSAIYAMIYGFSWRFSIWTSIVFLVTILVWSEWIVEYQVLYLICSFFGNGIGAGLYYMRKKGSLSTVVGDEKQYYFTRKQNASFFDI